MGFLMAWMLSSVGCGTARIVAYQNPTLRTEDLVELHSEGVQTIGEFVTIKSVDGSEVDAPFYRRQVVLVEAGKRTISLSYYDGGGGSSTENAVVELNAEPGRQYLIKAERIREGFWKEMALAAGGGTTLWVAWVEREDTRQVVAGVRPTQTAFKTDFVATGNVVSSPDPDTAVVTPQSLPVITPQPLPPDKLRP